MVHSRLTKLVIIIHEWLCVNEKLGFHQLQSICYVSNMEYLPCSNNHNTKRGYCYPVFFSEIRKVGFRKPRKSRRQCVQRYVLWFPDFRALCFLLCCALLLKIKGSLLEVWFMTLVTQTVMSSYQNYLRHY